MESRGSEMTLFVLNSAKTRCDHTLREDDVYNSFFSVAVTEPCDQDNL